MPPQTKLNIDLLAAYLLRYHGSLIGPEQLSQNRSKLVEITRQERQLIYKE